jgi:aryl-alcohol dehydrogenase-like predicted oxidoreductase
MSAPRGPAALTQCLGGQVQSRKLGNSDLMVSPWGLGANVFGWTADEATSFQLLDAYVAAGGNFIDTADVYSIWAQGHTGGESEAIIGRWMKARGNRKQLIITTKVGMEMGPGKKGLARGYIQEAAEASLKRLQTDYIDVYLAHEDDPKTPFEETLGAFGELVRAGKARTIGASNYSAERLEQALQASKERGLPPYQSLQMLYNLYDRAAYEEALEPLCVRYGLGTLSYFSLARGFLSGKYRSETDLSKSPRGGGIKRYLNERGMRILDELERVAQRYQSAPTQVALAWVMARPSITSAIASASTMTQLQDLIAGSRLQLDAAAIEALNRASA